MLSPLPCKKSASRSAVTAIDVATDFEISPTNPNILWVGDYQGDVYRSTDGGKKWKATGPVNDGFPVDNIAPDPKNSQIAYAVTSEEPVPLGLGPAIYKTNNGGSSWSLLQEGISNITVDLVNTQTLYTFASNGVSVSRDGGHTWNLFQTTGLPVPFSIFTAVMNITSDSLVIGTERGIYTFGP